MRNLAAICLRHFFAFLGWLGAVLILYTVISLATKETWAPLERWAGPISSLLTITATLITATSVYYPSSTIHPPDKFSTHVSAWIVIVSCTLAILAWILRGDLPSIVVNSFALLGLSGAFFRLQVKPQGY